MSFAEMVSDMTGILFSDAGLGEAATYTGPSLGAVAVGVRAILDEPTEQPFLRDGIRSQVRERVLSAWLTRVDELEVPVVYAKDGVLVVTTSHGVVRTVTLVSPQESDPDRVRWSVREVAP